MGIKRYLREFSTKYFPSRLTFGITVCNEAEELKLLLEELLEQMGRRDEIIVLQDISKPEEAVNALLLEYRDYIRVLKTQLNDNFSEFKNNLIQHAKGKYLFQIDADELLSPAAVPSLKKIIMQRPGVEVFFISRENYVAGLTDDHIAKWNWSVDEKKRINYPDYQSRIFRLNKKIFWKNKVHEVLTGAGHYAELPAEIYLIHNKSITRQEKQNEYYDSLS